MRVQVLCNGDPGAPLEVAVFDWDADGSHDFIGAFTTSLNQLLAGAQAKTAWPLVNAPKKLDRKKAYAHRARADLTAWLGDGSSEAAQ